MFCQLGPDARDLLGVIAFFPQGVDMNNLDWLFPTIPNRQNIFDKFCALSLTYRSSTFITMLAPLRDYLCPKDPKSSPLLCTAKNHYFSRLSVGALNPGTPGFEESKWVMSEDVNIEHLLDVFTSADADSDDVWDTCASFVEHLCWHKPRLVMLGPKLEGLPDKQPSKPTCLFQLALLAQSVGNDMEAKRLFIRTLELWRGQGNDLRVAQTLVGLAVANQMLGCFTEGMQQVEESQEIFKQLNHTLGQAESLQQLAWLLWEGNQLDAAEGAASQSINLLGENDQSRVCQCYNLLGDICRSKGEIEKAINHYKAALEIASSINWHKQQFWILYCLAELFFYQDRFDDAHGYIELSKSQAVDNPYLLGRAMEQQAEFWYMESRFEEAKSEVLCAVGVYEKVGAAKDVEDCKQLLQKIEGQ